MGELVLLRMLGDSPSQFASFVAAGMASSSVTLFSRYLFNFIVPYEVSVALSQITGAFVAFVLNRCLVFRSRERHMADQFWRFLAINLVSLAIATAVSSFFFRLVLPALHETFYPAVVAQVFGLAVCAVPSFLGHKHFSFSSLAPRR